MENPKPNFEIQENKKPHLQIQKNPESVFEI